MLDLTPKILPRLAANRLPGIDLGSRAFYPDYNGFSIANLPASVCRWLGVEPMSQSAPSLNDAIHAYWGKTFRTVVVFVLDGFGLNSVQQAIAQSDSPNLQVWRHLPGESLLAPLTSVVPSTTANALTTFWSGALPAEHGVVGYELFLKEYGMIANMILHNPASFSGEVGSLRQAGFNPETFLPVPVLGPHLLGHGVKPYAFLHRSIAFSGLSSMLQQQVETAPIYALSDLFINLSDLLDRPGNGRSYIYAYWSNLDDMSHRYGPDDERIERELASFSQQLGLFLSERSKAVRGDTLFVLTADHGHIETPKDAQYELRNHPDLLACMSMRPSGEARLPYVYLRAGKERAFETYVEQAWQGRFKLVRSEAFARAGLFGGRGQYARLSERIGDYVMLPQGNEYLWFKDRENPLLGRHGGLSQTEMLSPFLGFVL
jgi:hypothetical protein